VEAVARNDARAAGGTAPARLQPISIGVQDFEPRVLDIVKRPQEEAQVREVVDAARALGFSSVSFDLIYGLPLQTADSIEATMDGVERLRPDQVCFYPYAHGPWIKPSQRRFTDADLPACDAAAGTGAGASGPRLRNRRTVPQPHDAGAGSPDSRLARNFIGYSATTTH
jgi:hypothetical protein